MTEFETKSEVEILRELAASHEHRANFAARLADEMRGALGIAYGNPYGPRVKALLAAEAERDAAVKARDVVEAMYHIERRRADKLQAELDARGA